MSECPWCNDDFGSTPNARLRHVIACELAPPPAKQDASGMLALREAMRATPIVCCKLRKKIELNAKKRDEESTGIADSEVADVMTFDRSPLGRDVVVFRHCPWCGQKWVANGHINEPPLAPSEEEA